MPGKALNGNSLTFAHPSTINNGGPKGCTLHTPPKVLVMEQRSTDGQISRIFRLGPLANLATYIKESPNIT